MFTQDELNFLLLLVRMFRPLRNVLSNEGKIDTDKYIHLVNSCEYKIINSEAYNAKNKDSQS